jgi:hypothetical protein
VEGKLKRSCEKCFLEEDQNKPNSIKDNIYKLNSVKCEIKQATMKRIREKKSKILGVVLDSPFISLDKVMGDSLTKVSIYIYIYTNKKK